jgi:hypothetical protein
MNNLFKICSCCQKEWFSQEDFLSDKNIKLIGYKADFEKLEYSSFFFNHLDNSCNSTITIQTISFLNLYNGEKYSEKRIDEKECPGYCRKTEQLNRCNALCECAYNREISHIIKNWIKK